MKKFVYGVWVSMVAIVLSSCSLFQPQDTTGDIVGTWESSTEKGWYRVFTTEKVAGEEDYCWGKEWHEQEDVYEGDLEPYGNGWYKWKRSGTSLLEIEMMNNNWADIPNVYTITLLNETDMSYKGENKKEYTFRRVVSPK